MRDWDLRGFLLLQIHRRLLRSVQERRWPKPSINERLDKLAHLQFRLSRYWHLGCNWSLIEVVHRLVTLTQAYAFGLNGHFLTLCHWFIRRGIQSDLADNSLRLSLLRLSSRTGVGGTRHRLVFFRRRLRLATADKPRAVSPLDGTFVQLLHALDGHNVDCHMHVVNILFQERVAQYRLAILRVLNFQHLGFRPHNKRPDHPIVSSLVNWRFFPPL